MPETHPLPPGYTITTDPDRLDRAYVHAFLTRAYWSKGIPRETVDKSLDHSLCFGLYGPDGTQKGLARVVTDRATFAYIADVFIDEAERGHGFGKALMTTILAHPDLRELRRILLATLDAHGLYAQFGFGPPKWPENLMERLDSEVYAGDTKTN